MVNPGVVSGDLTNHQYLYTTRHGELHLHIGGTKLLKIYRLKNRNAERALETLLQNMLANLEKHPNVFIGETIVIMIRGHPSIAQSIPFYLNAKKFLSTEKHSNRTSLSVKILSDTACGLSFLHGNDIVHGNVSTANVRIDVSSGSPRAVLMDTGISKALLELDGDFRGLPLGGRYAPPELFLTEETDDRLVRFEKTGDVYMFGQFAHDLHDGYHPLAKLSGPSLVIKISEIKSSNPSYRPEKPDDTPDAVWLILSPCFHFNPSTRSSMKQIHEALVAAADGAIL